MSSCTLNEKIGGNDIDGGFIKARSVGDPAALNAIYASGSFNTFKNLDHVPMLHYRTYNDTLIRATSTTVTATSPSARVWRRRQARPPTR